MNLKYEVVAESIRYYAMRLNDELARANSLGMSVNLKATGYNGVLFVKCAESSPIKIESISHTETY